MLERRTHTRFLLHAATLIFVAAAATFPLIADFDVRMANTSSDDGIVGYSYFLRLNAEDVSRRLIDGREFWEFYSRLDERGL